MEVDLIADDAVTPPEERSSSTSADPAPSLEPRRAPRWRREPSQPAATEAEFIQDSRPAGAPHVIVGPLMGREDVFDPPRNFQPLTSQAGSALPHAALRLPDRPSMMARHWAVPEGENLRDRMVRKVPIVGLLLTATGAVGTPRCPPKSEHPDCLRDLIDAATP